MGMRFSQRGLSLVELMIAMAIGLFLILGATEVLLATKRSQSLNEELARSQERIRFTKEWLTRDLRQLGYSGCGSRNKHFVALDEDSTDLGFTFVNMTDLVDPDARLLGVTGFDGDHLPSDLGGVASWRPDDAPDGYPRSDILTLGSIQPGLRIISKDATANANLRVVAADSDRQCSSANGNQSTAAPSGLCDGDLLIAADCDQAVLFVGTNVKTVSGCGADIASCTQVVHSEANTGGAGNSASVWQKQVERFGTGAELIRIAGASYFVGLSGLTGEPALMRCEQPCAGSDQWEELVPGIENLQVWYRRGSESDFLRADQIASSSDWERITALRISAVVRSQTSGGEAVRLAFDGESCESPLADAATPLSFADGRNRQKFCFTVALRNRLK